MRCLHPRCTQLAEIVVDETIVLMGYGVAKARLRCLSGHSSYVDIPLTGDPQMRPEREKRVQWRRVTQGKCAHCRRVIRRIVMNQRVHVKCKPAYERAYRSRYRASIGAKECWS